MADTTGESKKRKNKDSTKPSKRQHTQIPKVIATSAQVRNAGNIHRIFVRNFMCHEALEVILNPNVNFIVGRNGSGKSAILTALTVGLGARAGVTMRGNSVKEFIKKGKNTATIEISIINEGPMSYKYEDYGNMITVIRTIGSTSSYKLKSAQGQIISTKKEELENLLSTMNIQVENPISILNQDAARSFLVAQGASEKYQLFMKATQMDIIGNNYKEAQIASEDARRRLNETESYLSDCKKEVDALEKSLKMVQSVEAEREEFRRQQLELFWASAITEEKKLEKIEQTAAAHQKSLGDIEGAEDMRETKEETITSKIEELNTQLRDCKGESDAITRSFEQSKERYIADKETYSNKFRELKLSQSKINRAEADIDQFRQEIKRIEGAEEGESKKAQLKEKVAKKKQDLDEVEAMLRTKQTDQMHLQTDKVRLEQEEHSMKNEFHHCEGRVRELTNQSCANVGVVVPFAAVFANYGKSRQKLSSLKQQSDSSLTVFGPEIPRLLKRIDEEDKKRRFKRKPIGPLGAYIKIKDSSWTPAVESYLGAGTFCSFAVDNGNDAKILNSLIQEICRSGHAPNIITSKFLDKIHDVSRQCTRADGYINLLDVMEISEPVVANCLIDQREPECCLLIPTSKEASEMLSVGNRVPPNCKRALTKQADEFFPDPNYRSYGGRVGRAKFLQVSTSDAIQAEGEELAAAENELAATAERHRHIRDKLARNLAELGEVSKQVTKLRTIQHTAKSSIDALADELDSVEPDGTAVFLNEIAVNEERLVAEREVEQKLAAEIEQMRKALKSLEEEVRERRELMHSCDGKVNKIKDEIRKLDDEKEMLKINSKHAHRRLLEVRQAVQKVTSELESQKRVTQKLVADAEKQCPRMETTRSVAEIKLMSSELKAKISAVEKKVGSKEALETELKAKEAKYNEVIQNANLIGACNDKHLVRLQERREIFQEVKKRIGQRVKTAFSSILELRQYKGTIQISHQSKTLELEMTPQNTAKRATSDARTLSGGERSYSTVAFILALWDCTTLPFYFLDEFDVFMDKVNRRIIMDILLDHTRSHPESQFAFLTPLDTSIDLTDDYITIHQLAPPERTGDTQN